MGMTTEVYMNYVIDMERKKRGIVKLMNNTEEDEFTSNYL